MQQLECKHVVRNMSLGSQFSRGRRIFVQAMVLVVCFFFLVFLNELSFWDCFCFCFFFSSLSELLLSVIVYFLLLKGMFLNFVIRR